MSKEANPCRCNTSTMNAIHVSPMDSFISTNYLMSIIIRYVKKQHWCVSYCWVSQKPSLYFQIKQKQNENIFNTLFHRPFSIIKSVIHFMCV